MHPVETEGGQRAADIGIGLGNAFGMVLRGVSHDEVKDDGKHQRSRGSSKISASR